ncbi:MAG: type I restriction enzyme HsdR N-terminal domain-containing protein [Elusimicrobia bacterium]|nr:type I restriction enzyme HsdR N-terminal domain-containing protein [Elusimicrobiota bacterium]
MKISSKYEYEKCAEFRKTLEKNVYAIKGFSIQFDCESKGRKIDCCIKDGKGQYLAIIEFKSFLNSPLARKIGRLQLRQYLKSTKAKYALLTDSKKFYLYKNNSDSNHFEKITFIQFLETLFPKYMDRLISENYEFIKEKLKENHFDVSRMTQNDIVIENHSLFFSKEFEKVIVAQLPSIYFKGRLVCRYVSLETAFRILESKKIRMNGIVGMNDSTESDFLEKILYDGILKTEDLQEMANNIYIMSCSTKDCIDKLTQWRLYGDDARGVCLVFKIKRKALASDFKLGKIYYQNADKPSQAISNIKEFLDSVYKETLFPFMFRNFHEFAHFFKPEDYKNEKEVRLLCINKEMENKKWFLSKPLNVVNSYVEMPLLDGNFPLDLSQIYLGPKCPEREVNQSQLKTMLKEMGRDDVGVILSEVDCYR